MAVRTPAVDLPGETLADIGRMVVDWGQVERQLCEMIYAAGQVDPRVGRLIVRKLSATEKVSLLRRLLDLTGKTIEADLTRFSEEIDRLECLHNALVHGVWRNVVPGQPPCLRLMRDAWPPAEPPPVQSRRFDSEVVELDATICHDLAMASRACCDLTAEAHGQVMAEFGHAGTSARSAHKHRCKGALGALDGSAGE